MLYTDLILLCSTRIHQTTYVIEQIQCHYILGIVGTSGTAEMYKH
jgi:hypothetical protein